jgi:hypothetical protein
MDTHPRHAAHMRHYQLEPASGPVAALSHGRTCTTMLQRGNRNCTWNLAGVRLSDPYQPGRPSRAIREVPMPQISPFNAAGEM